MSDHIHLKWLKKIVTSTDSLPHAKNFITQPVLKIKLTHYSPSLWACLGMPDHTHLKHPTNICCIKDLSSHIQKFNFNLFVRYSSLKNPAFWLALRFLGHNWRTRFFPKVKGLLTLPCWSQKVYISELIRFLLKA